MDKNSTLEEIQQNVILFINRDKVIQYGDRLNLTGLQINGDQLFDIIQKTFDDVDCISFEEHDSKRDILYYSFSHNGYNYEIEVGALDRVLELLYTL